jgi:hypothetical protein
MVRPADGANADESPIDGFYGAHAGLIRISGIIGTGVLLPQDESLLGGQLLLGFVSATELYLRQSIARAVQICPVVRARNRDQTIPFGALDYYPRGDIEHSLTERVSFSEPGTIGKQLNARLGVTVTPNSSLQRSIADFEKLCQLRHSLVHSHGVINSSNAALLLGQDVSSSQLTAIDAQALQWIASVTMNLARDVSIELVRTIIWCWVTDGIITGDGRRDRPRLVRLIQRLGSTRDASVKPSPVSSEEAIRIIVRDVLADLARRA